MHVTRIRFEQFMLKIARTREEEASCDDCARLLAKLVETLLRGDVQDQELQDILHHLQQCSPCSEEFVVLRDCAKMDQEHSWPTLEEMWSKLDYESASPPSA